MYVCIFIRLGFMSCVKCMRRFIYIQPHLLHEIAAFFDSARECIKHLCMYMYIHVCMYVFLYTYESCNLRSM